MATSGSRDQKIQADRLQLVIQELLKDEDNKYCVDCDAKGPRWASWNIGVFLCIRCAGIHRNLGVHISKVKSVNLDSWTATQLAAIVDVGNSRARAIYEARLPSNFRRPQTDSALEMFIRSKYEQKRYIALDYVPTKPNVHGLIELIQRLEQSNKKSRSSSGVASTAQLVPPASGSAIKPIVSEPPVTPSPSEPEPDLLGLNGAVPQPTFPNRNEDLLDQLAVAPAIPCVPNVLPLQHTPSVTAVVSTENSTALPSDLVGLSTAPVNPLFSSSSPTALPTEPTQGRTSKDAILALYHQQPLHHCPSVPHPFTSPPNVFPVGVQFNPSFGPVNGSTSDWGFSTSSTAGAHFGAQVAPSLSTNPIQLNASFVRQPTTGNPPTPALIQTPAVSPTGFASWPDPGSTSLQWSQPDISSMVKNKSAPENERTSVLHAGWNPNRSVPASVLPGQMNAGFPVSGLMVPGSVNTATAAHQAYLSQVQSQLSSLQLSSAIRNSE